MNELRIRLNAPQTKTLRALGPGKTVCIPWGRGVGKSWFQRLSWYTNIAKYDGKPRHGNSKVRGYRCILFTPTFKQAVDIHGRALDAEINGEWSFLGGKLNKTHWRVEFPGGSWIQFLGAENADAARGFRADQVTTDECDDIDSEVYDAICKPWLSETWSFRTQLLAGTPRRGRQGLLYKTFELGRRGQPNHFSLHATYRDAPEQVSQSFVEEVRATTPPEIFAREWECDFDAAEGLVYSSFMAQFHVRPADPRAKYTEILVGVDHGWEDPGVFVVVGVRGNGRDATCHVLEEVYEPRRDTLWWQNEARRILAQYGRGVTWYTDPSRPDRISELRAVGARTAETNNSIEAGVSAVQDRLTVRPGPSGEGEARLYIDPSCKNLIREFGLYRRKRNPRNRNEVLESIEDKHNHTMDALRYALCSRFGAPQAVRDLRNLPAY